MQRLLQQNYTKRLGCMRNGSQDVRLHRYFATIDMPQLLKMRLPPPHVPKVNLTPTLTLTLALTLTLTLTLTLNLTPTLTRTRTLTLTLTRPTRA